MRTSGGFPIVAGMRAVELVLGFACNCRCAFCPGLRSGDQREMNLREIVTWLHFGRSNGASVATLGGGEPTLHRDFLKAARAARELGYETVEVASNGIRFAEQGFTEASVQAGVNLVSVGVLGSHPESHDRLAARPGAFVLLDQGIRHLAALRTKLRAEVLITETNRTELAAIVERFAKAGLSEFRFWLVSMHGLPQEECADLLPRLGDLKGNLQEAFDRASRLGVEASTLHVPPCALDAPYRSRYRHAGLLDLVVVTPGARPFRCEESPIEGGTYLEACQSCSARPGCLGLRADYLAVIPGASVHPVPPA